MKKQLLFFVLMLLSLTANAAGTEIDGIHYALSPDTQTASVTYIELPDYYDAEKYYGDIVIPSTVTSENIEYTVTAIGWKAFANSYVTSVTIPNSVKRIEQEAFSNCPRLTSIIIPNGVTNIDYQAFQRCSGLTSIIIPNSVTNIGSYAFQDCNALKKVIVSDIVAWCGINFNDIESNPLIYAKHLYSDENTEITDLVIPNSVTSIGQYAFSFCQGLTSVTIGDGVTSIGNEAFRGCTKIASITIPASMTSIGGGAFNGCTSLASVTIDNGVTDILGNAFYGCSSLASIEIPNSVTSLGNNAFEGTAWYNNQPDGVVYAGKNVYRYKGTMPENTSIVIEDGTYSITSSAFGGCKGLTAIAIPSSVTSIGSSAFSNCSSLTSITIPNSVTSLEYGVFLGCTGLTTVTIGSGVTSVEERAFRGCSNLTFMTILCEVVDKWFDENDYYNPSSLPPLEEIVFGEGVKTIKDNAFNRFSNIKTIDIASTVTSIGAKAFSGTNKLTDVTCRAINVPEMDRTAFENSYPNYATLHVPAVSQTAYKETAPWSEFKEVVAIKQDLPVDAEQCATPTISYKNGKLSFASATEGVEYLYQITDNDIKSGAGAEVSLNATYHISVYATKEGYKDSETATATLCWIDQKPATEGITDGIANVPAKALLIKNNGSQIIVEGAADGEAISVYTVNGRQSGSAISQNGAASIDTNLQAGSIAIVKIGDKSVKVVIK